MKKDMDAQFICKDCENYNLCRYYHNRKEDSYICKYFHLPDKLDKIRAEIKHFMYDVNPSSSESDYACNYILQIIDKYKADRSVEE